MGFLDCDRKEVGLTLGVDGIGFKGDCLCVISVHDEGRVFGLLTLHRPNVDLYGVVSFWVCCWGQLVRLSVAIVHIERSLDLRCKVRMCVG